MKAKQTGFTLIELMFTIVVLAVLLGIGVPNFRDFIRNSRMTAAANDLLGDINLARSESVMQRTRVVVCAVDPSTPDTCLTNGTEFSAWTVFLDENADNTINTPSTDVVRRHARVAEGITGHASGALTIAFLPSGFAVAGGATQVLFCDGRKHQPTVGNVPAARAVTISPIGRAGVTRPASGCP